MNDILQKYVDMVENTKCKEEVFDIVVKIILDAINSKEIQDSAYDYVNKRLDYAAMDDSVCKKM